MSQTVGIIPARMESARFPGKVLAPIGGKPLLEWVIDRARQATRLDRLLVATDSEMVTTFCRSLDIEAVMTRADHPSGSDRVYEAACTTDADLIINVQGDEPLIDPALIDALADRLQTDASCDMVTAATPITELADLSDPSVVKVVCNANDHALYFSRACIPHYRDVQLEDLLREGQHLRHLGIYGYRKSFLKTFISAPPAPLELAEKLEQLRALHLGGTIALIQTEANGPGVDHPEDVPKAEAALRAAGLLA